MTDGGKDVTKRGEELGIPAPPTDADAAQAAMSAAQRSRHPDTHNPISLIEIAGQSALYSGIQAPITGALQLFDHVTGRHATAPSFFKPTAEAQFGSAAWFAQTIGSGAGFMLPFIATEGLSEAGSGLAARAASADMLERLPLASRFVRPALQTVGRFGDASPFTKAIINGGASGFLFSPSQSDTNFWKDRAISGAAGATMFGVQAAGARGLSSLLSSAGLDTSNTLARIGTRLTINAGSGALGGMASAELTSKLGTGQWASGTDLEHSAVAAAATGFALDSFHLAREAASHTDTVGANQGGAPSEGSQKEVTQAGQPTFPDTQESTYDRTATAPLISDRAPPAVPTIDSTPRRSYADLLLVDRYTAAPDAPGDFQYPGGSQKFATVKGKEFWQLPDGRIYHEEDHPGGLHSRKFWSPYGSEQGSYVLLPTAEEDRQLILKRNDTEGIYRKEDGTAYHHDIKNDFREGSSRHENPLPVDEQTLADLTLSMRPLEPDHIALQRLVPFTDGQLYQTDETPIFFPKDATTKVPTTTPHETLINEYMEQQLVPTRTYFVLPESQMGQLADLQTQHTDGRIGDQQYHERLSQLREVATPVIVPEDYAQRLDAVRALRRIAMQPSDDPASTTWLGARRFLFLSPYGDRFLPEHVGQFLDGLPNRKRVEDILLLDSHKPEAIAQDRDASTIMADANAISGRIRFFKENYSVDRQVRRTTGHEWSHLQEGMQPDIFAAYKQAAGLEPFIGREYATKNDHEHWAVHTAEMFMDPNPQFFITLAERAPLRTVILAHSISRELQLARPEYAGINNDELQRRVDFVQEHVMPRARESMMDKLASSNPEDALHARLLFDALWQNGGNQDVARSLVDAKELQQVMETADSHLTRAGRFDPTVALAQIHRAEILARLRPQWEAPIRAYNESSLSKLESLTAGYLLDPSTGRAGDTLSIGEQLAGQDSTRDLFHRLYPADVLAQLAHDRLAPDEAERAFALLSSGYDSQTVVPTAIDLLQAGGPNKEVAARYLLVRTHSDKQIFPKALNAVRNQFSNGDYDALGGKGMEVMSKLVTSHATGLKGHFRPWLAIETLQRAELMRDYLNVHPEERSSDTQQALRRAQEIHGRLTKWFADCVTDKNADIRKAALGDLENLSRSPNAADQQLAREIAPRTVLKQAVDQNTPQSQRAYALYIALYQSQPIKDNEHFRMR